MTQELSNNVIEFPKHKIFRENVFDCEEIERKKEKSLKKFADSLTQEITENMLMDFDNSGINIESESFIKDFHFLVNVLTATIYRTTDLKHDLHTFIDERVKLIKVDQTDDQLSIVIPKTMEFDELEELDKPK